MAPYKENFWGKLVPDDQGKFNSTSIEGTMKVELQIPEDGSAFFTYSSHDDHTNRLTTFYKSQLDSQGDVGVSMNFTINGKEFIPQVNAVVQNERSEFIELEKPVLWKMKGKSQIMIEKIYYHCKNLK